MSSLNYCSIIFLIVLKGSLSDENDPMPPCSQPKGIAHGITDWDGRTSKARFACFQGYHLVGPPQIECRYGTWYSTYPTCKPIVCNLPTISHGRLEGNDNIRYRVGMKATVLCDEGYEITGRLGGAGSKLECKGDGSWESPLSSKNNGKYFPVCKEKPCNHPDISAKTIANGTLEINGKRQGGLQGDLYQPGAVAIYSCRKGFVLLPLSAGKRVCRKGMWEGQLPACLPQTEPTQAKTHCPAPPSIANGYALTDRNSETPLALPVFSRDTHYERGTIARYHCKDGYTIRRLHGQVIYRCASNGEWSPKVPPVCIKSEQNTYHDPFDQVMCPSHNQIPHTDFERVDGWLTSNGAVHGTVLEYSCQVGYRDINTPCLPTRRTCHAGKWVGNMPSCVPFEFCDSPPPVSHGFMATPPENAYTILSEIRYQCHPGFRMKSISALKCHSTGCWTPLELPQCIREDIYRSKWSNSGDSDVPLVAILTTVTVGCAVIAIAIATVCIVIICRRKGGHLPPPAGPAHWSTTVTVTPECRSQLRNGSNQRNDNGSASRYTTGATELHRQITIPTQHMHVNGQQNGNGHVGQLRGRDAQPDRMTMIAIADGSQAPLPSYEEALRHPNTTTATAETSTATANGIHNGAVNINANVDSRSYRNNELNETTSVGTNRMDNTNIPSSLGIMSNMENLNSQPLHQRAALERRQIGQLPIVAGSNDNIDMDDTPTSDNSHSVAEGNPMMPLHQMYETQLQQLNDLSAPVISSGCILSTNISQGATDINRLIPRAIVAGSSISSYETCHEILINTEGGNIQNYTNDTPPKPPTRHHSNISRVSRNGDFVVMPSIRRNSKSSSRGYSSRSRIEDPLIDTLNPDSPRAGYVDGGQLVVSLPHTWNQQQHRRGNQRRNGNGTAKGNRQRSSSSNARRANSSAYTTGIGNNLEGHPGTDDISESSSHNWTNTNHLTGGSGRNHGIIGQAAQPGSATASLRSRQSTQSGGSNGSGEGGWVSHQASGGSDNISSITSTTVGSASTVSGVGSIGIGVNGADNCSTSTHSAGSSGQTPSCKALAGSLTSFDTCMVVNTEGIPLLEENEIENEGSNSSDPGDTVSATGSEGSSK